MNEKTKYHTNSPLIPNSLHSVKDLQPWGCFVEKSGELYKNDFNLISCNDFKEAHTLAKLLNKIEKEIIQQIDKEAFKEVIIATKLSMTMMKRLMKEIQNDLRKQD